MRHNRPRAAIIAALLALAGLLAALPGTPADAGSGWSPGLDHRQDHRHGRAETVFEHIATFDVMAGNGSGVAEIIDASPDGRQLVYTDAENGQIGFVDISDPTSPTGAGVVQLDGEPTSLVIRGDHVLVAVNTSPDFVNPSGHLVVIDRHTRQVVEDHDLGGQPDSAALSPNERYLAVVIENERDEDLDDGLLPQLPSGGLMIADIRRSTIYEADFSDVAAAAPGGGDLEPEFVDINRQNEAVVTFQENNWLAVVDLRTGKVKAHFSAGEVTLHNVDTVEDDLINLDSTITRRREPDAVAWLDNEVFAIANEGDYEDENGVEGGARGFTLFTEQGEVVFESGESFEHAIVSVGQYNEGRSENKGVEPESAEYGRFGRDEFLFIGSERSNAIGVYDVEDPAQPRLVQILPTGIGPEGIKAVPKRNLLVASTEAEAAGDGIPTMVNLYRTTRGPATYPMIRSADDANGNPIPWVALSGLVGDPSDADTLYAVSDSFLAEGFIYTIDVSQTPAVITDRMQVTGASAGLDLEGVAVGPDGSFWLGSEGDAGDRPNLVLQVDPSSGAVVREIELPAGLVDQARSNGIEGIAVTGEAGAEQVHVAIQRAWPNEGDTDEVNTKIGRYDVATGTWGFVHYPLEAEGLGDWIGLSELTALPDGTFAVIERDKGWGPSTGFIAELKVIQGIDLASAEFRAYDDPAGLVTIDKTLLGDVVELLAANSVWTSEKLEGLAVAADGQAYAVTDNDGVDDVPGDTVFLRFGDWREAQAG